MLKSGIVVERQNGKVTAIYTSISLRSVFKGVLWGLLGIALLAWALPSHAGQANVSWTPPTQNCNGTLVGSSLTGYILNYGKAEVSLPNTARSYTITNLTPGKWWFSLAVTTATARSEFITASKDVLPSEFVTKDTKVYSIVRQTNRFLFIEVGTVPLGVVCDATQPMGAYYVVPRESVNSWVGSVRPGAVVASCG